MTIWVTRWVSYKKLELLTLGFTWFSGGVCVLGSPGFSGGVCVAHHFTVLCCLSSSCVLCVQFCQCLLIVPSVFSNGYLLFRKTYLASVLAHVYLCILWELLLGGDKKQWVVLLTLSRLGSKIFACCSLAAAAVASVIHEALISTSSSRGVIYLIRLFTSHSPWSEGFQPKAERLGHISIIQGSLGNYIYISECDVGFCHYLNVSYVCFQFIYFMFRKKRYRNNKS